MTEQKNCTLCRRSLSPNIPVVGVNVLSVQDGVDEAVGKLFLVAQQLGFDKTNHAVVFLQVVLQRCPCQV